jgi:hypothetical protein
MQICNEEGDVLLLVPFKMALTREDELTPDLFRSR